MTREQWMNVAKCADTRALQHTFSLLDNPDAPILGELASREMAQNQAYRETLLLAAYSDILGSTLRNR
jgi:hypothetical protein